MKKIFLNLSIIISALAAAAASTTAVAAPKALAAKPACPEFPYDMTEEEGVKQLRHADIYETTRLTPLQGHQMLATAKWYSQMWNEPTLTDAASAVKFLKEGSEGADLYYKVFRYQGVVYTQVLFYPGGNPYGLIFKGRHALAAQTDGDVGCL